MPPARVDDRREPVRDHRGAASRRRLGQDQDRRVDPRLAQRDAFLDQRDAEPGRAGFERGARDRHRAVAVPVGLHHREHLRRGRDRDQRGDVVAHRAEVDLHPGRPRYRSLIVAPGRSGVLTGHVVAAR